MDSLFAPWRFSYLIEEKSGGGCVFCAALARSESDESGANLVIHRASHNFVILNLYPYNNGHLMVIPNAHLTTPADSTPEQRSEMMELAVVGEAVLTEAYHPQGFNMGMNLGQAAGAGIAEHFHLHIVPRWSGDTNFMTVTAGTRVIPQDLKESRELLRKGFDKHLPGGAHRP